MIARRVTYRTESLDAAEALPASTLADVEGWFPLAGIELDDGQVEEVVRRAQSDLDEYIEEDGRVTFGMPIHFVTNVGG